MGCGESKIKKINLTSENDWQDDMEPHKSDRTKELWEAATSSVVQQGEEQWKGLDTAVLPNSLLATIPTSELGESLDCRPERTKEVPGLSRSAPVSANSLDSGDSGYEEYEEEYAHIITEHSSKQQVEQVVQDFTPVDLPELLVITGRACTRILSGYEKNKQEEENILSSLRAEGLLARPGGKAKSGISFEIVDIKSDIAADSFVVSASHLPGGKLSRLEERRENVRKPEVDLETQLAEADNRRRMMEQQRIQKLSQLAGADRAERARQEQVRNQERKQEDAMLQRKEQLESMRSKLKEKTKKADMLRLKKALALDSSFQEADFTNSFFDD